MRTRRRRKNPGRKRQFLRRRGKTVTHRRLSAVRKRLSAGKWKVVFNWYGRNKGTEEVWDESFQTKPEAAAFANAYLAEMIHAHRNDYDSDPTMTPTVSVRQG